MRTAWSLTDKHSIDMIEEKGERLLYSLGTLDILILYYLFYIRLVRENS